MFKDQSTWKRRLARVALYTAVLFAGAAQPAEAQNPFKQSFDKLGKNIKGQISRGIDREINDITRESARGMTRVVTGTLGSDNVMGTVADEVSRSAFEWAVKGKTPDPDLLINNSYIKNKVVGAVMGTNAWGPTRKVSAKVEKEPKVQKQTQQQTQANEEIDKWEDPVYSAPTKASASEKVQAVQQRAQSVSKGKQILQNGGVTAEVKEETKKVSTTSNTGRKSTLVFKSGGKDAR